MRRVLHGRDGQDPQSRAHRAHPRPDRRLLAGRLDHRCATCGAGRREHPGAIVVSYVNTTAAIKAESDYCVTSGNAEAVIRAIPDDREILFLPDMFLGAWLKERTGRENMQIWMGECHVHAGIRPDEIARQAGGAARTPTC